VAKVNYPAHKKNIDFQRLKIVSQYCLKIILSASINLKEATLKETKQSISHTKILLYSRATKKKN
jgi:hypothetical protein